MRQERARFADESDPRTYRGGRRIAGTDPRMVETGQRVTSTTGELSLLPSPTQKPRMAAAFDPTSTGFALFVIVALLFLIHARFSIATKASIGTRS